MERTRRLRTSNYMRDMVRENHVRIDELIYPIFVTEGENIKHSVESMPGIYQYSLDRLSEEINRIKEAGIKAILIFGIPDHKDEVGSGAYAEDGIVPKAIRQIKKEYEELLIIADVCLCEYTSHGHCGLVKDGVIVGAEDTKMLGRQEKALDSAKVNQKAIKNARSGWSILLCQSIREYQKAIEEQVIFWIMVALAVLLIFVLLIYRVTKPVMISVNDIVDAMKNLEKDNFREKLEVKEKDSTEIQEISEGFNEMSERIHNLIGQVKESAMEQKNAEISALEAQIDPHFLYNILDTINWKAIENEQYEISEMLVALADILRYAINDAGEFTTIDAEKGWLEKYILLQQEKLGEEIELEFKIQDSYGKCKIHKMLLQPFVENAIKYSFRGYEGAHRLTIEVSKAEEQMHIIIANNGRHIEEDQLKDLNMGKEIKNHFGISNVRKRLKLYYGEDAVIYFENVSPSGVKVHLFVPLQEEQKDEDSSY